MAPILSSLVNLQAIETELRDTEKKRNQGQQLILRQKHRIDQLQAVHNAKKEEIKHTRLQYDRLDLELKAREEEIAKLRVTLNSTKTNKGYSAVLTRINTDKADSAKLEDQILALMTQIDNYDSSCREIEKEIETEKQKLQTIQQQTERTMEVIQKALEELQTQRQEAAQQVPNKELSLFKRLAQRYEGAVLSEVQVTNSKRGEYNCGGCYMSIPLEIVNLLMTRDEVMACPTCGRILVLDAKPSQQPTA